VPVRADEKYSIALPALADPRAWLAVVSGLSTLRIAAVEGPDDSNALCLDYDFGTGSGFVVARREVVVPLPESWEARLLARSTGPANTLEIKLVDASGTSVWRWMRDKFDTSGAWIEIAIPSRDFLFAWGPAGGGSIRETSAVEVAVVAGPGGAGSIDLGDLRLLDRSPGLDARIEASSVEPGHAPELAFDDDPSSSWQSRPGAGPHSLTVHFSAPREIGGVVVWWPAAAMPRAYRIDILQHDDLWTTAFESTTNVPRASFLELHLAGARALRIVATAVDAAAGTGVVQIDVRPVEWSRTQADFLTNVALQSRRGAWPRYLRREQTYWTPVATPHSGPTGLINDDGAVEIGEGGFMLEPSFLVASSGSDRGGAATPGGVASNSHASDGRANASNGGERTADSISDAARWITWADIQRSSKLERPPEPIATVGWKTKTPLAHQASGDQPDLELEITAIAEDCQDEDIIMIRYRVRSRDAAPVRAALLVAVRPLQVSPPWQKFRDIGGPSPITRLEHTGGRVLVDDVATIAPIAPFAEDHRFGAAVFEEGGLADALSQGVLPLRSKVEDPSGRAEGVLAFDLDLRPGQWSEVYVESRRRRSRMHVAPLTRLPEGAAGASRTADVRFAAAGDAWKRALPTPSASGPIGAGAAIDSAITAVAHILCCRDDAALQPGPRRYTRSWIRDGAIMSAALLRTGRFDAARAFLEWYAPFQREDGFVPCCVDRDGVDPLVEHDSHGQLIYLVAETYRFTHDKDLARKFWSHCQKAAECIEALRATRRTGEFDCTERRACFGLLPESVSHEGYLAQPVHSYWDDFWALRGLRDASFLARELGLPADAEKWREAAGDLATVIRKSIETVVRERNLVTVPASVEWADFDPTSIAGAISLVGEIDLFPAEPLAKTFDQYMKGLRGRHSGALAWNNFSPYEVRIVGALVRLGRRDEANELLLAMMAARRPDSWRQWPEIVWRDIESPAHLGDLPHCWIGAEYVIALRTMFVYERESDAALVLGAGLRREWLDSVPRLEAKGLPTWYGTLDLAFHRDGRDGRSYRIVVRGAKPPGGFVAMLPEGFDVSIDVEPDASGEAAQ